MELGLQTQVHAQNKALLAQHGFDFIIGSIHAADNKDLYNGDYYLDKSPEKAWDVYLDALMEIVKAFDKVSIIGHLDIIKRYSEKVREVPLAYYKEKLIVLFKEMIKKDIGLEVNTSGLRPNDYGLTAPLPSKDILELYYNTGGRIITIGSDSHDLTTIASNYKEVVEILKHIGFKELYYTEKMRFKTVSI